MNLWIYPIAGTEIPGIRDSRYFNLTAGPGEADFLVVPTFVTQLLKHRRFREYKAFCRGLAHYKRQAHRHVIADLADYHLPLGRPHVSLRASVATHRDITTFCIPYPLKKGVPQEIEQSSLHRDWQPEYDVSFMGYGKPPRRVRTIAALSPLRSRFHCRVNRRYISHCPDRPTLEQEYLETMRRSRLVLCPPGAGQNARRFFEVLAAGRVPILVSDRTVLPFTDSVDYNEFCLIHKYSDLDTLAERTAEFLDSHSDDEIRRMGMQARAAWEQHLAPHNWGRQLRRILDGIRADHTALRHR